MNKIIDFYLRENHLSTSEENRYMANVVKKRTVEQEELVDIMLGKNTTVTRQDMIVVLDLLKETVMEQILSGYPVKTDLFKANVSIRGGFLNSYDEYSKSRHAVCVNMNSNTDFRKELAFRAKVEQVLPPTPTPYVRQIFDYEKDGFSTEMAAGTMIALKGAHFRDEERGTTVYLTPEGGGDSIPMGKINQVKDRTVICHLPEPLTAGKYYITVALGEGLECSHNTYKELLTIT